MLTLSEIWLAEETRVMEFEKISFRELLNRSFRTHGQMQRHINSPTKGLLDVIEIEALFSGPRVVYSHWMVRDWSRKSTVRYPPFARA